MEKVFEEIRSLVRRERYEKIHYDNVVLWWRRAFHDPLMKNYKKPPVGVPLSRKEDDSITGWRFVPLHARIEKKLLKHVIVTTGSMCTCRAFFYRKKKNYKCKHIVDFEIKKEMDAIVERFLCEKGLATHIKEFLGQWDGCICENQQCNLKATWKMDNGVKVCKKCLPKVKAQRI